MVTARKIFFDGGLRPEGMETAIVTGGRSYIHRDLGPGTSMTAEWLALIAAARLARTIAADVVLLGDAAAVVAQANGRVRTPPAHHEHHAVFQAIAGAGPPLRVRHIGRSQNLAGIALARLHPR